MKEYKEQPGYKPLTWTLFVKKDTEFKRILPVRFSIRLKSSEIPCLLDWMAARKIDYRWQDWDGELHFYVKESTDAMMLKLTWAAS